jgi:hypothetical protein
VVGVLPRDHTWTYGKILHHQYKEGWGTKVIDRLSADLRNEFPEMKGFSVRNIKNMRAFAKAYPEFSREELEEQFQFMPKMPGLWICAAPPSAVKN